MKVYELKKIKEDIRNDFDVDFHHEWIYFKPDHNLSKFKEQLNRAKQIKSQASQSVNLFSLFGI